MASVGFSFVGRCERSSSTRWLSDRRLCGISGDTKAGRTWSRRQCQRDGLAILRTLEKKCWIEQRRDSSSCAFRRIPLAGPACLVRNARCSDATLTLDEAVRQVGGMLITDSRGIFDALTRSESQQLRLRRLCTGEEARGIKEQCAVSNARIQWVNTLTMLTDSLTKPGYPARAVLESFLGQETMEMYLRSYV